jgi:hypothetical protein
LTIYIEKYIAKTLNTEELFLNGTKELMEEFYQIKQKVEECYDFD